MPRNTAQTVRRKRGKMLKPEEITVPEFSKGIRGYTPQEVDNCINTLLENYRELYIKYAETEEKLGLIVEKYKETSSRAGEALKSVRQISEAIIEDAQCDASRIIAEAEEKAKLAKETTEQCCKEILSAYAKAFDNEKGKFEALEEKSKAFRESLLEAYSTHLAFVQESLPEINADEIKEINFEARVSDLLDTKLQENDG